MWVDRVPSKLDFVCAGWEPGEDYRGVEDGDEADGCAGEKRWN